MNILVTGGCGMIGFNIAKTYKDLGHNVYVVDNLERSELLGHSISTDRRYFNYDILAQAGIECHIADISIPETFTDDYHDLKFDVIFHMAAQCGVPTSIENPRRDFEVNCLGTFNMLEKARKDNSIVVYASTNKVYPIHDTWVKRDSGRWEWMNKSYQRNGFPPEGMSEVHGSRTPYGASKYAGDLYCREWASMYGLRTGVFRMSCIYGNNQFGFEEQGWATWFAIATLKGEPIKIYGDGDQVRDMLFVSDCVDAYSRFVAKAIADPTTSGVYNLGGGVNNTLSLNECLDLLEKITGKRSEVTFHDWRSSDQKVYTSSLARLEADLEWKPTISPEEGLRKIVEWVKPNLAVF
jgi:CDP-paratose 2-epimerase